MLANTESNYQYQQKDSFKEYQAKRLDKENLSINLSLLICFQRLYSCLVFLEFLLSIIIGVNPVLEAVPWFPDQYFSFLSLCYLHFLSYHFWFWKSNTETNSPCLNVAHTYTFFFFFRTSLMPTPQWSSFATFHLERTFLPPVCSDILNNFQLSVQHVPHI